MFCKILIKRGRDLWHNSKIVLRECDKKNQKSLANMRQSDSLGLSFMKKTSYVIYIYI